MNRIIINDNKNATIYVDVEKINYLAPIVDEENVAANIKCGENADNYTYMRYITERSRSHGLFGNIDTSDLDKVSKDVYDLTKQGKNIYRGIISLSQKDAEMQDFTNRDLCNTYLKSVMPDIAKASGISSINFTWVAAYHAETKHPHVHFQLWDNRDLVK